MGLRTMLRQAGRKAERHGVAVQDMENGSAPIHKMELSPETLTLLEQGYSSLMQQRQQLVRQLGELDVEIQKQVGGIHLMRSLLAGKDEEGGAAGEPPPAAQE